jgi:hypothetical protein
VKEKVKKCEKFWETVKCIAQTTIPQSEKVSKPRNTTSRNTIGLLIGLDPTPCTEHGQKALSR